MFKLRVYIDTSVVGGCLDKEFKEDSIKLFKGFKEGKKIAVVSDILLLELEGAPREVKNILDEVPPENIDYVSLNKESISLANAYLKEAVIAERSLSDARHIAIATVNKVDVLVSWNFKHIVNISRIHLLNSVNLKSGYPVLEIRSPKEVLNEEEV